MNVEAVAGDVHRERHDSTDRNQDKTDSDTHLTLPFFEVWG